MNRVLIVSHDVVEERMAGPAIRCWEMARSLEREFPTTLAVPNQTSFQGERFDLITYNAERLRQLSKQADLVVVSGCLLLLHPFLKSSGVPLVVDLYDPFHLENLQLLAGEEMAERLRDHDGLLGALRDQVEAGDFFLCASERQRDFWLGLLSAWNRINPYTYSDDPSFRRLIDVVPYGLPEKPPQHTQRVLKDVHPGIKTGDQVILWNGGIYDWLDPLTAIKSVAEVHHTHPQIRLFFMGTRHPNPLVSSMQMVDRAVALAEELGLKDRVVFFNDWVPYAERGNYLLEADIGLSLHLDHLETRFAFRTRLLDCIWAGLPMVVTGGDTLADTVREYSLGHVVQVGNVAEVAHTLEVLLDDLQTRANRADGFHAAAAQFRWEQALRPLIAFARAPRRAADRDRMTAPPRSLTGKIRAAWRRGGPRQLSREIRQYLRWLTRHSEGWPR
ncbi:MAG: glycosyltransferase family 4 protein [Anaerolineae bacterium]|jgi:glycosyltransferase involved in cell wall biosynthesis